MDHAVRDGACVPCEGDAINDPGDDPSGPDTYCDDACSAALGLDCAAFTEAYLKATSPGAYDEFGFSLALEGDTLVVGAHKEASGATGVGGASTDDTATNAGAVYVFERSAAGWTTTAYIKASNAGAGDLFGVSVALDGDTLVVGAPGEMSLSGSDPNDNSASWTGAVYVFSRAAGPWQQTAYIKASNAGPSDRFGDALALDGDTLVVGARLENSSATGVDGAQDDDGTLGAGAAYVFERGGDAWAQSAYLKAAVATEDLFFGASVAVDGDTIAIGAVGTPATSSAVYLFERSGLGWTAGGALVATYPGDGDYFGYALALADGTLVVGAPAERSAWSGVGANANDDSADRAGAVSVFPHAGGVWSQSVYIKASNTRAVSRFGEALALEGDSLAVGAILESSAATGVDGDQDDESAENAGAVYLFSRALGAWRQEAYIKATNTDANDLFGHSLALSGATLAIGAPGESSAGAGVDGDQADNSLSFAGAVYVRRVRP